LPKQIKDALQTIYSRTQLADVSQRSQEFGFTIERNGASLSPSKIKDGIPNADRVDLRRTPNTLLAAHSHGAGDLLGASPPDVHDVQSGIGNGLPIYIVSRAGIILFDPNDKSTQGVTPGSRPADPSYGVKVGDLTGKNSIFKKPCN
jgi:hypothetical protein